MKIVKGQPSVLRRINLLFFVIVFLFTMMLLRLGYMQLINKSFYTAKLKETLTYQVKSSNPRGKIYDANGTILVDNTVKQVIAFTRDNKMTGQDLIGIAKELLVYSNLSDVKVSQRAKIDYYLSDTDVYKTVVDALPNNEKYDGYGNSLLESKIYSNAVASLKDKSFDYSDDILKEIYIFNQLNDVSTFNTKNLDLGDLSEEQLAKITAKKSKIAGISLGKEWDRKISDSTSLSALFGTISTEKTGLPKELVDSYLKKGYVLNDRVGLSYLEKEYESYLQGEHTVRKIKVNKKGSIVSDKTIKEGSDGENLKLTIDTNFQNGVDDIVKRYFESEISSGNAQYSEGMYAVALEPETGKILALSGLSHEQSSSDTANDILGTFNNTYTPGSVVKGATISSGWENNVLSGNEVLYDQEIANIKSWFTQGLTPITATQALEYSSNTYMVQIALRLMGQSYTLGDTLTLSKYKDAMKALRKTYAEFGLGASTGFDLPESTGYLPKSYNQGEVLNESFGQFDAYTTLQLAQYVATVANGGKRIAPHLVEGIYKETTAGGLGNLVKSIDGKVMDSVNISQEDAELLQDGFYNVVNSNSAYATGAALRSNITTISGKTGTAETSIVKDGQTIKTVNLNVIAYDQDKKIAVAVMYPHVADDETKVNQYVARDIIDLYVSNH